MTMYALICHSYIIGQDRVFTQQRSRILKTVWSAVFVSDRTDVQYAVDGLIIIVPTARNPFTDQRYLIAVVPRGILLMQWYQPQNAFKLVMVRKFS